MLEQISVYLTEFWQWVILNRDWLFSGLGLTTFAFVANTLKNRWRRSRRKAKRKTLLEGRKIPESPVILKPDHSERLKYDPQYRKLHQRTHMDLDHRIERRASPSKKSLKMRRESNRLVGWALILLLSWLLFYLL